MLSVCPGWAGAAAAPPGHLPAAGDRETTAQHYGLEPGLHVLALGWYPVRDFVDWADPPMDANGEWFAIEGVQFGRGTGQLDLAAVFDGARWPPRLGKGGWHSAWRADGWLWVEQEGEHAFRIAAADDAGRLTLAGRRVALRGKRGPSEPLAVTLPRGFHRLRLEGVNRLWGLGLATEWKRPGDVGFSPLPAAGVFRGLALTEGPRLFQAAVAGLAYDVKLAAAGGKAPRRFRVVRGALPRGLSLSDDGRLRGTPAEPGFFRFAVAVRDAAGLAVEEPLGLRVLPSPSHRDRNDAEAFQLTFDETDPRTLQGGLIAGRGMYDGLRTVGDYALYPFHRPLEGKTRSITVAEGRGAFGSRRFASMRGVREYGFFFCGQQGQVMSDHMPAFRRANRLAVTFRIPGPTAVPGPDGPVTLDWHTDPRAFQASVFPRIHVAGHNVTRYVGHRKEQWNWHFYHPMSPYWGDHWQAANVLYLGDGWWLYVTSDQSSAQRSGTVDLAGWYEPQQDTDARYFDTLNRFYHVIDRGWGRTDNTHADDRFDFDHIRIWREEPGVEIRHAEAEKVARRVIPEGEDVVDVPFLVTHTHPRAARYWVSRYGGKIPKWDGKGIWVDANANGAADPGEAGLDLETPLFQPRETKRFVYRVETEKLAVGRTLIAGVNLRVHDRDDPLSLRGDSMMILIHRAAEPSKVHLPSLTSLSKGEVRENRPPVAAIDGPRERTVRVGEPLRLTGSVADPDGPHQPQPAWDLGDGTAIQYGATIEHRYARPGVYTVRLRASDSILERAASVTVRALPSPAPQPR